MGIRRNIGPICGAVMFVIACTSAQGEDGETGTNPTSQGANPSPSASPVIDRTTPQTGQEQPEGGDDGETGANPTGPAANPSPSASPVIERTTPQTGQEQAKGGQVARPEGWTDVTHGNDSEPDYEVVFPQDRVNQIKITVTPADWEAMQADATKILGEPGSPITDNLWAALPENPTWVPATIEFEGKRWTNVGFRYRGASSLRQSWHDGSPKLPFKLDFDEFEDRFPEIDDQRFHGFEQLALSNGSRDPSYMRDPITYHLLDKAGLPAARTAYYEVLLDHGDGPVSLGLYIMIEVIDDTVVPRHFNSSSGNIYEGDGPAASLALGMFDQIPADFQKENNREEADWSDVQRLYQVLHSSERTTNPSAWQRQLEEIFDTGVFLEWLAVSSAVHHWDTYGAGRANNYYLYNDPRTGKLTWISWDHNGILTGVGGVEERREHMLSKEYVDENWPLIRFMLDDPYYFDQYVGIVRDVLREVFIPAELEQKYRQWAELIRPYAAGESGEVAFNGGVEYLIRRTYEAAQQAEGFLATVD